MASSAQLELACPEAGTDAALWRDIAIRAIRAGDLLADAAIARMDRENEAQVNAGLKALQSVEGYWKLRHEALDNDDV